MCCHAGGKCPGSGSPTESLRSSDSGPEFCSTLVAVMVVAVVDISRARLGEMVSDCIVPTAACSWLIAASKRLACSISWLLLSAAIDTVLDGRGAVLGVT